MNRRCYNVVGTIRVLPKQNETWIQYEDDKMMYKEKLCPFVFHADFECFCVKEHKMKMKMKMITTMLQTLHQAIMKHHHIH